MSLRSIEDQSFTGRDGGSYSVKGPHEEEELPACKVPTDQRPRGHFSSGCNRAQWWWGWRTASTTVTSADWPWLSVAKNFVYTSNVTNVWWASCRFKLRGGIHRCHSSRLLKPMHCPQHVNFEGSTVAHRSKWYMIQSFLEEVLHEEEQEEGVGLMASGTFLHHFKQKFRWLPTLNSLSGKDSPLCWN